MVSFNPSSNETVGCQFIISFAFVISGCLCLGSSSGNDLYIILLFDFVFLRIFSANSIIVNSEGFPILIGPVIEFSVCIILYIASIKSST